MGSRTRTDEATAVATAATGAESSTKAGTRRRRETSVASTSQAVELNCLMNARYHSSREAFLDSVHRWFMFGVVLTGAGAISGLFDWLPSISTWFGAVAALLGAADLAFDLSNRARTHSLMKRRYFELMADMRDGFKTADEAEACTHRFSADEEPAFHALLMASWNAAQEMVYGASAAKLKIPAWHRWFQNVFRFEGTNYPSLSPP